MSKDEFDDLITQLETSFWENGYLTAINNVQTLIEQKLTVEQLVSGLAEMSAASHRKATEHVVRIEKM